MVKVNGVAADGPLAHHMPAIAGKVMEARGSSLGMSCSAGLYDSAGGEKILRRPIEHSSHRQGHFFSLTSFKRQHCGIEVSQLDATAQLSGSIEAWRSSCARIRQVAGQGPETQRVHRCAQGGVATWG